MKLKAFEAHNSCGHFAPKNFKIGSVVKKLSPKNRGVGIKLLDTVYLRSNDDRITGEFYQMSPRLLQTIQLRTRRREMFP